MPVMDRFADSGSVCDRAPREFTEFARDDALDAAGTGRLPCLAARFAERRSVPITVTAGDLAAVRESMRAG